MENLQDEPENTPFILNGKYFVIQSKDETGNVNAKCVTCQLQYKGKLSATSNFLKHLNVSFFNYRQMN